MPIQQRSASGQRFEQPTSDTKEQREQRREAPRSSASTKPRPDLRRAKAPSAPLTTFHCVQLHNASSPAAELTATPPLSVLGVPDARCDGPSTVDAFPTRLPSLEGEPAAQLRSLAQEACDSTGVVRRLRRTICNGHGRALAPLLGDFPPKRGAQGLCRGEALLYAASGMALAPFGPGVSRCVEGEVCWFGIADCGRWGGASLQSLQLRARLVGPSIFLPHLAYLPLGPHAGVLLGWYCPPTAGTYALEARLESTAHTVHAPSTPLVRSPHWRVRVHGVCVVQVGVAQHKHVAHP
jgi:hypothetical protein